MSLDVLHRNSNIEVTQNFPDPCIKDSMNKNIYQEDIFLRMQRVQGTASGSHGTSSWARELLKNCFYSKKT